MLVVSTKKQGPPQKILTPKIEEARKTRKKKER